MKNKYMTVDEAKEKLPLIIDKVRQFDIVY